MKSDCDRFFYTNEKNRNEKSIMYSYVLVLVFMEYV